MPHVASCSSHVFDRRDVELREHHEDEEDHDDENHACCDEVWRGQQGFQRQLAVVLLTVAGALRSVHRLDHNGLNRLLGHAVLIVRRLAT